MSNLSVYEIEDIAWEEFGDNDSDHIVPHNGGKKNGYAAKNDCSKRTRYELSCAGSTADNRSATNNAIQKEETSFRSVKEDEETMLEKGPWAHSSGGAFSASLNGDANRQTSCSTSDEYRTSNGKQCMRSSNMDSITGDLCADDSILGDRAAATDNNLFRYQLNGTSHAENDLGFLGNNLQDKESSDLLYYGWPPEIENFEDVDRMFRSCDSTFGLEIENDNELGWFSTSREIEGSDDALDSSFNFSGCDPCAINSVNQPQEVYGMNSTGMLNNETDQKPTPVSLKRGSQNMTPNGCPNVKNSSYTDGSGGVAHIDNDQQIHSHVSQSKHHKASEGKRKERSMENGDSFINLDNLKQVGETNHSMDFQCSFPAETQQEEKATYQTCLQAAPIPLMSSSNGYTSNQDVARPKSPIIKPEDSGFPSASPRDSSYGSNQMRSLESSHVVSLQKPAVSGNKKKERLHQCKLSGNIEKSKLMVQTADSDPVSSQKQVPNFESEVEGQSEVNGSDTGILGEMDSSNVQESSCMSSVLDEVSIEASSFRQLQHVMEQLDIRTKLCIRDSLYRLARSAEQRHKCVNQSSGDRDDKDANEALVSDETNRCTGFMDMETDTNPIDRSIAHLLFHRPSDPSATAAIGAVPAKSYKMVQVPNNGPVMAEKLLCQEETTSANNGATEH